FHYDPEKAASYSSEQAANYTAYQKQQEETRRQQANADAKNKAIVAEQQAATHRTQALQARYNELQKQEDDLLLQIGLAQQPGPAKAPITVSSESSERRSSRKKRRSQATGEGAALSMKAARGAACALPKLRETRLESCAFCTDCFWSAMHPGIALIVRHTHLH